MAAYGTNQYTSTGNPLCDRLKRRFADRCTSAVKQYSAPSTSVMIERVQKGLNPYENAPDPLKEKRAETRSVRAADMQRRQIAGAAAPRTPSVSQTVRSEKKTASAKTAGVRTAAAKPASVKTTSAKPAAAKTTARPKSSAGASRAVAISSPFSTESMRRRSAAAAAKAAKVETPATEVRISRAPFPFTALIMLSILTVMAMIIMLSSAQNYELSSEIDTLTAEHRALLQTEEDLTLCLEERDDIRVIEDIAVNEIGMVKNDLVESRFVTVSGGNRVELSLPESEEAAPRHGIFGNLLSAIGENFEKLREYID